MAEHTLDIAAFREAYPLFRDVETYPDAMLTQWWAMATCAMNPNDTCVISGDCLQSALYLMMAHIGLLLTRLASGQAAVGSVTSATIDKVAVSFTVPPFKNGWQFWLSQTPYGAMLWAMLSAKSAGGFYVGLAPERAAFRRVGGMMW